MATLEKYAFMLIALVIFIGVTFFGGYFVGKNHERAQNATDTLAYQTKIDDQAARISAQEAKAAELSVTAQKAEKARVALVRTTDEYSNRVAELQKQCRAGIKGGKVVASDIILVRGSYIKLLYDQLR